MLEVGLLSLQVVHAYIGKTGSHFQGCTAVSEIQLLATTQSKCGLPKLMLGLVGTKSEARAIKTHW